MSTRPEQPEPFLRGCVFPAVTDAPYPRADPAEADYLPADVWDAAQLPVGVRLELLGNARTIRVWYKTTRASLGYRGESAGCSFVAYRGGQKVAAVDAVMGEGMAELVMAGRPDLPVTVYFPEGMQPIITGVAGVEETMIPAPLQPRWLAYGDAVTQGWLASAPAMAWPAVAGRKLGLDVCNLGYAGTARGETTSALLLAETPAEVVSIAFGLNNWSRVPHTTGLMAEEVRCFLSVVREGHPEIPIVVVSPTARPDAEDSPNRVGATLAELRLAMEEAVLDFIAGGDEKLFLVHGLSVVDPEDLEDGVYPGDEGHRRLAAAVSKILVPHLGDLQTAAEKRWASEGTSATAVSVAPAFMAELVDSAAVLSVGPDPASEDFGSLNGDPLEVASRNFDLTDIDSLDRAALDNALLEALSPNGPSPNGASANGPSPNGASANAMSPNGTSANGASANGVSPNGSSPNGVSANGVSANGAGAPIPLSPDDVDGGSFEFGPLDAEPVDAGLVDAELVDAEAVHAGLVDAGPVDAGPVDAGPVDALSVDAGPVDAGPVDAGEVDEAEVDEGAAATTEEGSGPSEGSAEVPSPAKGEAEPGHPKAAVKKPPVRETTPVDIEVADMVVAALSLATNGADDVIVVKDPGQTEELEWSVAAEPGPS